MDKETIAQRSSQLDSMSNMDPNGVEFWYARDLYEAV